MKEESDLSEDPVFQAVCEEWLVYRLDCDRRGVPIPKLAEWWESYRKENGIPQATTDEFLEHRKRCVIEELTLRRLVSMRLLEEFETGEAEPLRDGETLNDRLEQRFREAKRLRTGAHDSRGTQ